MNNINLEYCAEVCPVGKRKCKQLMDTCDSPSDMAIDFMTFANACSQECLNYSTPKIVDKENVKLSVKIF